MDYTGAAISGSLGNLTRRIAPVPSAGQHQPVTLFKYDSHNNLLEVVPPRGVNSGTSATCSTNLSMNSTFATDLGYDTSGADLLSMTQRFTDPDTGAQTAVTRYAYGDSANPGRVTSITSPRNFATTLTYNSSGSQAGLLASIADPLGDKATYSYDSVGRRTSVVDPNGNAGHSGDHTWTFAYDNEDHLTSSSAPAPSGSGSKLTASAQYDPVGNRTQQTDPKGQITYFKYDVRNLLNEVDESATASDPNNDTNKIVTTYSYDNLANLQHATRASGGSAQRTTDYAYDGRNRVRSETQHPTGSSTLQTTFTYDGNSNLLSQTDPMGQSSNKPVNFGYDALNRRTSITFSDGSTPNVSYTLDLDGNRTAMSDGTGSTSYVYDELDRVTSVTSPGSLTVGYRYDLDSSRRKIIYPDSTAVSYAYDNADRLQQLTDWASRTTSYTYNPDGTPHQVTNVNGTTATFSYDNAQRLNQVLNQTAGSGLISQHAYTLDATGNRTQDQETVSGSSAVTLNYDYDHLYRLTCDGTNATCPNSGTTGTYQCTEPGIDTYCYDAVGNRINQDVGGTSASYSYDGADRLTSGAFTTNDNGNLTGSGTGTSYGYDQANRLTSAIVGGTTATYTWDGDGKRTQKTVNGVSTNYAMDANSTLPLVLDDGTSKYIWGATGVAYSVNKSSGSVVVYHQDGLGSTRALTDSNGNVTQTYGPSVWGTGASSTGQPFQWTGQQFDPETGFTFYGPGAISAVLDGSRLETASLAYAAGPTV